MGTFIIWIKAKIPGKFNLIKENTHAKKKIYMYICTLQGIRKKTAKRKGPAVDAPVQEESAVAAADGGLVGGPDVCSDTPDGGGAAQVMDSALGFTLLLFLQ